MTNGCQLSLNGAIQSAPPDWHNSPKQARDGTSALQRQLPLPIRPIDVLLTQTSPS